MLQNLAGMASSAVSSEGGFRSVPGRIAHRVYLDWAMAGDGQAVLGCFPEDGRVARQALLDAEGGWRYRELTTGHDAMITAPSQLANLLLETTSAASTLPPATRQALPVSRA